MLGTIMKNLCHVFLILVASSYVSCEEGFDLYNKERREFRQEIDRLFSKYYFTTSPRVSTVKNGEVVTLPPVATPDSTEDSYDDYIDIPANDAIIDTLVLTHLDPSSEPGLVSTKIHTVTKAMVSNETTSLEGSGEGSGEGDDDDDGEEDVGSGMDHKYLMTTVPPTVVSTRTTSVPGSLSNPDYVMCGKTLVKEAHSCNELALNIRTFLNEIQILTQILLQMKPKHLKPNYSVFMPIFKVCLININYPPSCDKYTTISDEVLIKISNEMTEFARKRDRDLEISASGRDFTCLSTNLVGIEKCVYSRITNDQVDQMLRVIILSTGNWNHQDCKDFQVVKQCILRSIEQCNDDITYQLNTIILNSDVITTCHTEGSTTEINKSTMNIIHIENSTAGNNNLTFTIPTPLNCGSSEITPGLLLTVGISILLSRL